MTLPLHARVADSLRDRIADGTLAVGAALPSEAVLVDEFGASRGTVRQALATLRVEGLIEGGQGRSPVVRDQPIGQPFETFLSFTAWAHRSGREPGQRTVEIARRAAGHEACLALGLGPGSVAIDVTRLRLLDGAPTMLERSTFSEPVGRMLFEADTDAGSIYAFLLERGVDLARAEHTIDAVAADAVDAHLLEVDEGAPLLRERRIVTDRSGHPLEFADDRYRPDRATFTIQNAATNRPSQIRHLTFPGVSPHE